MLLSSSSLLLLATGRVGDGNARNPREVFIERQTFSAPRPRVPPVTAANRPRVVRPPPDSDFHARAHAVRQQDDINLFSPIITLSFRTDGKNVRRRRRRACAAAVLCPSFYPSLFSHPVALPTTADEGSRGFSGRVPRRRTAV